MLGLVLGDNAEYLGYPETAYYGLGLTWTPEFMIFDGSYTVASEDDGMTNRYWNSVACSRLMRMYILVLESLPIQHLD